MLAPHRNDTHVCDHAVHAQSCRDYWSLLSALQRLELRVLREEGELDIVDGAVALLCDRDLPHFGLQVLRVDEDHHVGVLLDGARLAQVGEGGLLPLGFPCAPAKGR